MGDAAYVHLEIEPLHRRARGNARSNRPGWLRGTIAEGKVADLVIFDPDVIADQATYDDPHQYPKGIETVIVNGVAVIERGDHTGALPGRLLRRCGAILT